MLRLMHRWLTRCWQGALAVFMAALVLLTPAIAAAQSAAPAPNLRRAPPVWIGLLVMAVLLGMVLAVSLMPSKRSHQD